MAPHRQKDAEGATLMTRKRLWKDPDGQIVTKRPALESQQDQDATQANTTNQIDPQQDISPGEMWQGDNSSAGF